MARDSSGKMPTEKGSVKNHTDVLIFHTDVCFRAKANIYDGRWEIAQKEVCMYIIAGLGNPGTQYMGTRHNAGFSVIDALADQYNISVDTQKHKGMIGKGMIEGEKVILVKPMTYMNLSGECIREVMDYYKADIDD